MPLFQGWHHGCGGGKGCWVGGVLLQQLRLQAGLVLPCTGTRCRLREAAQQFFPEDVSRCLISALLLLLGGHGQSDRSQGGVSPTLSRQCPLGCGHQQGRFTPAQRIDRPPIGLPQLDRCCPGSQCRSMVPQQALTHDGDRQAQSGRGEQEKEQVPGSCGHAVAGTHHILRPAEGGRPPVTWDAEGSGRGL